MEVGENECLGTVPFGQAKSEILQKQLEFIIKNGILLKHWPKQNCCPGQKEAQGEHQHEH